MPARGRAKRLHLRQQNSRHVIDGKFKSRSHQLSWVFFSFAGLAALADSLNR